MSIIDPYETEEFLIEGLRRRQTSTPPSLLTVERRLKTIDERLRRCQRDAVAAKRMARSIGDEETVRQILEIGHHLNAGRLIAALALRVLDGRRG